MFKAGNLNISVRKFENIIRFESGNVSRNMQEQNMFSDLCHKFVATTQLKQKPKQICKKEMCSVEVQGC